MYPDSQKTLTVSIKLLVKFGQLIIIQQVFFYLDYKHRQRR